MRRIPVFILLFIFSLLFVGHFFHRTVIAQSPVEENTEEESVAPTRTPSPTSAPSGDIPTTGINLTVSPVFLTLSTAPGVPVTSSVKIRNNSNVTENLQLNLARFAAGANGVTTLADLEPNDPFPQWVNYSDEAFTISANETKTVNVRISPPKEAALGYYYALVVSRVREAEGGEGRQSVISGSPAIPVLLEVTSPNAKREVQLTEFKTDSFFYEYLPAKFTVALKNSGNIHVAPIGDIFIDWGNVQDLGVIPVNSGKGNILPNSSRSFESSWEDGFAVLTPKRVDGREVTDDKGNVEYTVQYDFAKANKFRIGKYTANLLLIYDNGQRDIPLEASVSFWVVPWRMILTGLVIIIAPALLVFFIMKWRYGKKR